MAEVMAVACRVSGAEAAWSMSSPGSRCGYCPTPQGPEHRRDGERCADADGDVVAPGEQHQRQESQNDGGGDQG